MTTLAVSKPPIVLIAREVRQATGLLGLDIEDFHLQTGTLVLGLTSSYYDAWKEIYSSAREGNKGTVELVTNLSTIFYVTARKL